MHCAGWRARGLCCPRRGAVLAASSSVRYVVPPRGARAVKTRWCTWGTPCSLSRTDACGRTRLGHYTLEDLCGGRACPAWGPGRERPALPRRKPAGAPATSGQQFNDKPPRAGPGACSPRSHASAFDLGMTPSAFVARAPARGRVCKHRPCLSNRECPSVGSACTGLHSMHPRASRCLPARQGVANNKRAQSDTVPRCPI